MARSSSGSSGAPANARVGPQNGANNRKRVRQGAVAIGTSLREELAAVRAALPLTMSKAATLIQNAPYLEALEQDRFDLLPLGSYRRTFLLEYAAFLSGLDSDAYADAFDRQIVTLRQDPPAPLKRRGALTGRLLDELPLTRTLAVTAGLTAVGLAIWQLSSARRVTPGVRRQRGRRPRPTRSHEPIIRYQSRDPRSPRPFGRSHLRRRTGAAGSWFGSVRALGRTIYEQTLQPGQTVRFGLRKQLWIRIGAPSNLAANIAGHPTTLTLRSPTSDLLATAHGLRPSP